MRGNIKNRGKKKERERERGFTEGARAWREEILEKRSLFLFPIIYLFFYRE